MPTIYGRRQVHVAAPRRRMRDPVCIGGRRPGAKSRVHVKVAVDPAQQLSPCMARQTSRLPPYHKHEVWSVHDESSFQIVRLFFCFCFLFLLNDEVFITTHPSCVHILHRHANNAKIKALVPNVIMAIWLDPSKQIELDLVRAIFVLLESASD
jgi:hypothetical protein